MAGSWRQNIAFDEERIHAALDESDCEDHVEESEHDTESEMSANEDNDVDGGGGNASFHMAKDRICSSGQLILCNVRV